MSIDHPNFTAVGIFLVKCDIDPKLCPVRKLVENSNPIKHYCWHDESPEPDHSVTDSTYRICITKEEN